MKYPVRAAALLIWLVSGIIPAYAESAKFGDAFADTTLRVDFILSGSCTAGSTPTIAFSKLAKYKGWCGRYVNLNTSLREGAADVTVTTLAGDTLYRNPFCTLFQEWLVSDDTSGPKAMEGTVLVPFPRNAVNITIDLRNNRRTTISRATISIDPSDILITDLTQKPPLPHSYIYRGDYPDSAKIHVAILAEGYTAAEMPKFRQRAREAVDAILDHEPFASLADRFDFIAIETPGNDSGVSIPAKGLWADTAFGAHFSTFYSDRYLTTPNVHKLYDALTSIQAHHLIVLANTDEYGGGGIFNFYTLTAADHENFKEVVVHEFGHSFGALADEYFYPNDIMDGTYPTDIEPWEPNITTQIDFARKWPALIEQGRASLIEGGGYREKGIWRGSRNCRMRSNSAPAFCPVCEAAITEIINWYTIPSDSRQSCTSDSK